MPKFGGYDFALVVTCRLTRFTRVFSCTKHITGEETIKILLEEWFCVYALGPCDNQSCVKFNATRTSSTL